MTTPDVLPVQAIPRAVLAHPYTLYAWLAARAGNPLGFTTTPGWCSRFTREVIEHVDRAPWPLRRATANRVASAIRQDRPDLIINPGGLLARERRPGDLIYWEQVALPYGHVAFYAGAWDGQEWTIENTTARRGGGPGLAVIPLDAVRSGEITLVARWRPRG